MNSKENQIRLLLELKEAVKRNKRSIEEAQYHLSQTFLQECDSKQTEKKAKKLDNDMELIIHTALIEGRQDAAMSVIDEAIAYIDNLDP